MAELSGPWASPARRGEGEGALTLKIMLPSTVPAGSLPLVMVRADGGEGSSREGMV